MTVAGFDTNDKANRKWERPVTESKDDVEYLIEGQRPTSTNVELIWVVIYMHMLASTAPARSWQTDNSVANVVVHPNVITNDKVLIIRGLAKSKTSQHRMPCLSVCVIIYLPRWAQSLLKDFHLTST